MTFLVVVRNNDGVEGKLKLNLILFHGQIENYSKMPQTWRLFWESHLNVIIAGSTPLREKLKRLWCISRREDFFSQKKPQKSAKMEKYSIKFE